MAASTASAGEEARQRLLRRKHLEKAMELCFDNELDGLRVILEDKELGFPIDPKPNPPGAKQENSFLSEAACGNAVDVMQYLITKGADPNFVGDLRRTPLHRALNNDAVEAVGVLLEAGADPRLLLAQARDETDPTIILFRPWDPEEVNGLQCCPAIKSKLRAWPIAKTLEKISRRAESMGAAVAEAVAAQEVEEVSLQQAVSALTASLQDARQKERESFALREERIVIYDVAKGEGRPASSLAIQAELIQASEEQHTQARMRVAELEHKLKAEAAKLRAITVAREGGLHFDFDGTLANMEEAVTGPAPRHPVLLVDATAGGTSLSFMTYRGVFMVKDVGNSHHFSPDHLRMALLSCLLTGRTLVINMRDKSVPETIEFVRSRFEALQSGLWSLVLTKAITEPRHYEPWLTDAFVSANPDFDKRQFHDALRSKFTLVLWTSDPLPPQDVLNAYFAVRCGDVANEGS